MINSHKQSYFKLYNKNTKEVNNIIYNKEGDNLSQLDNLKSNISL